MARRKKSKERQDIERRYRQARANLRSSVRRFLKQGYSFAKDIIPTIPKRITEASIRRIKRIKPSELVEYEGKRGLSARRERQKDIQEERKRKDREERDRWFEEEQRRREAEERRRRREQAEEEAADMGEIIYSNLMKLLQRTENIPQAKKYASKILFEASRELGMRRLLRNLYETAPEVVDRADLFLKDSEAWHEELTTHFWRELVQFGELPTAEQAREEGEAEDFQYTDERSPFYEDYEDFD